MAFEGIPPRERTDKSVVSNFGRTAAAIDQAEERAGERVGGPTYAETRTVARLEDQLCRLRPETLEDWRWLAGRLARSLLNGWSDEPLIGLAGDPLTVGCCLPA